MRQARITTICTHRPTVHEDGPTLLARACETIAAAAPDRPDLILLPEIFANHPVENTRAAALAAAEPLSGPITEALAGQAQRYGAWIAFGLLRRDGERLFNSLVLLDRQGQPAWTYDKVTPVRTEMTDWGVTPGGMPRPFAWELGRIAGAICFDINFQELAEGYAEQAVELLLFPSAFPAGRLLDAWAVRYGFAIAGSTYYLTNRTLDCTGVTVARSSDLRPWATAVLNLNRRVVHMEGNLPKLDRMRAHYPGDVLVEDLRDEALCALTVLTPGLEVADLMAEYEIQPLSAYWAASRRLRAQYGGLPA
ncbi:MAG: carbon-nitrogen hydrolase family protein [Anaerolineae bacterium]